MRTWYVRCHRSARLGAIGLALLLSSSPLAMRAAAQESQTATAERSYSIPAGQLAAALVAFGQQAGVQVSYKPSIAAGISSAGVTGTMSAEAALTQLLSGTGLDFQISGTTAVISSANTGEGATVDGAIALDTIDVSGGGAPSAGFQGTPDWVYETPASVSVVTREAIKNVPARDTRDVLSSVPGVYAGEGNGSFPTVSPNIRGLQDSGRIVVSVDGARQNAQRGFGSGAAGYQANSGQAFVDTAFIREVDINKNTDAKAGFAGSLGGAVNFRTVSADDLIAPGATWGMEADILGGTNEYNFRGSVLAATRIGEALSLTMGLSKLDLGEYMVGQNGGETASSGSFKGRDAWSSFLKLEGDFGDVKTSLSWMHQENVFQYGSAQYLNPEDVRNDSATAKIEWKPDDPLIDLKTTFWLSDTMTEEIRAARPFAPAVQTDMGFTSFGATLENTSRIDTNIGTLALNYGVEAFRDKATSTASSPTIAQNPTWASSYTAFGPPGMRDIASSFLSGELKPAEWVTVSGGVRYDWSRLHGKPTYYDRYTETISVPCDPLANHYTMQSYWDQVFSVANPGFPFPLYQNGIWPNVLANSCMPGTGTTEYFEREPGYTVDIDRTDSAWLPSATVEFKPVDWFRPFVSYGHSSRAPTILESFFAGGPPGDFVGIAYAPNIDLRSERAKTWEAGVNISKDSVLNDSDSFRFKGVAFDRNIDDFIVLGSITTDAVTRPDKSYTSFVNMDGVTTMRGVELEANYDVRFAWVGVGASWLDTKWPKRTEIFSNGVTTTNGQVIAIAGTVPPEFMLTLDGGVRLVDERLVLGARYTRVTPTAVNTADLNVGGDLTIRETTKAYSTVDLYGSFAFNEYTAARFAVTNLLDVNYIPATAAYNAPGRTITFGYQVRY